MLCGPKSMVGRLLFSNTPPAVHCLPVHLINVIVGSAVGDVLGVGSLHRECRWSLDGGLWCPVDGEFDICRRPARHPTKFRVSGRRPNWVFPLTREKGA